MKHALKFKEGDLVRYNHVKGYAGFKLGTGFSRDSSAIRENETFLVIRADPNRIVYFSDIGSPRYSYTIMMVHCVESHYRENRKQKLEGQIFDVVLDDCDGDEYLTILARV